VALNERIVLKLREALARFVGAGLPHANNGRRVCAPKPLNERGVLSKMLFELRPLTAILLAQPSAIASPPSLCIGEAFPRKAPFYPAQAGGIVITPGQKGTGEQPTPVGKPSARSAS
jgi:hypothetical protein